MSIELCPPETDILHRPALPFTVFLSNIQSYTTICPQLSRYHGRTSFPFVSMFTTPQRATSPQDAFTHVPNPYLCTARALSTSSSIIKNPWTRGISASLPLNPSITKNRNWLGASTRFLFEIPSLRSTNLLHARHIPKSVVHEWWYRFASRRRCVCVTCFSNLVSWRLYLRS